MADFHRVKRRIHGLMRKLDRESRDTMRGIESIAAPDMKN
jgi:D-ribulokinase